MRRQMHGFGGRFKDNKPEADLVTLVQLKSGQSGTVVDIQGGRRMTDRLNALGIIPGKKITKTSAMLMRGPVTIEVDRVGVAIGFGMASKVTVRPGRAP
jgi:ferrous iron transport protein A